jgi:hypothetical protein
VPLRNEFALLAILVAGITLAALLGSRSGVSDDLSDPRTSTLLAGPDGALGFARALDRLGVAVEVRRRPLFDVESLGGIGSREALALVNLALPVTGQELVAVSRYAARGGRVLVAGDSSFAACFGYRISRRFDEAVESTSVEPPVPGWNLPSTDAVFEGIPADSAPLLANAAVDGCAAVAIGSVDTLLVATDGRAVALQTNLLSGGWVKLLADSKFLTNRILKETDAGLLVLPWIVSDDIDRVVVDEYHQGFGHRGSLLLAAWNWLHSTPGGWAILHLCAATLMALAVATVRFGPPVSQQSRKRRSELEHLEALAVGLRRAQGWDAAKRLLVSGLRRRLGRTGHLVGTDKGVAEWIASLAVGTRISEVQEAVRRLEQSNNQDGDGRVLTTAQAVEEIWKTLRPERQLGKS